MAKIYGYARISTQKQNIERQVRNILSENKDAFIIQEMYSGKSIARPEFEKLLKTLKEGDTVIFDSVSRMSRNAEEGFELYRELYNRGVSLIFLKERHIDTATYRQELERQINVNIATGDNATDDLIKTIFAALNKYILNLAEKQIYLAFEQSQKEVDDLRQRTREGIETARRNGKRIGNVSGSKMKIKKKAPVKDLIFKHSKSFHGTLKDGDVISIINGTQNLHVSNNTYYKYKAELLNENL